ncbi:hypothetical protein [Jeotgalibacillus marinus]|uniref:Uncharacterized protein n=1 Tax=Jeotgalibacillus marinus TaxID=86667 RepID=A0ABV3Q276_9BACL
MRKSKGILVSFLSIAVLLLPSLIPNSAGAAEPGKQNISTKDFRVENGEMKKSNREDFGRPFKEGKQKHQKDKNGTKGEKLMEIVNEFAPELSDEWEVAIEERKEVMEQLQANREEKKDEYQSLSEEERAQKKTEGRKNHSEKIEEKKEMYNQLKAAIEDEDHEAIKDILEQMLASFKEHTENVKNELSAP